MPRARHDTRLTDGRLLHRLMKGPVKGGIVHTARSLAEATGVPKSKVSYMIRGKCRGLDAASAIRIAEALSIQPQVLFAPDPYIFMNVNKEDSNADDPGGEVTGGPSGGSHELVEHD